MVVIKWRDTAHRTWLKTKERNFLECYQILKDKTPKLIRTKYWQYTNRLLNLESAETRSRQLKPDICKKFMKIERNESCSVPLLL